MIAPAFVAFSGSLAAAAVARVRRTPADWLVNGLLWLLSSLAVAFAGGYVAYGWDGFGAVRLGCWTLFVLWPIVALVMAAVVRGRAGALLVGLTVADLAVAADAFLVEPHWLEVETFTVESAKVDRPMRIVVLSDIQTDEVSDYERDAIARAAALKPDLVLLPGDYVQREDIDSYRRVGGDFRQMLLDAHLDAPLGVYAVQGNMEPDPVPWTSVLFDGTPVKASDRTTTYSAPGVTVTALSFADGFSADLHVPAASGFHVVFGHGPDFALGDVDADLLVAGHTHGGQIRLPLLGPVTTMSQVPRSWGAGRTDLGDGRTLVVSRGIGMERHNAPRLRFLCRPEIVVIDVVPRAVSAP